MTRAAPLVRALLAREFHPARVATIALLAISLAALLGRQLASQAGPDLADAPAQLDAVDRFGVYLVARVGELLAVPAGIAAAAGALTRVAGDHEAGWLAPLAAAAPPTLRIWYLLGTVVATVAGALLHWALASLTFAHAGGLGTTDALAGVARALPGVAAFALSAALYGAAWGALLRRRGTAAVAAAAGIIGPVALLTAWRLIVGLPAPMLVARLLALPAPPLAWNADPRALLHHALYAVALLVPLILLAPRLVARTR